MAITAIWPIKDSLRRVINYASNKEKTDGILAFHAIQAFMPGEITPTEAHKIGVELANELWGNRFEVVVATHTDKHHIHSHFVINSVSFVDGKRYYDNKASYKHMRDTSDSLCGKYGLSIITPQGNKEPYPVWKANQEGKPTYRKLISQDVETALESARTLQEFTKNLKNLGYEIKQGKHLAIKPVDAKRFFRLYKLNGDKYDDENIKSRILDNNFVQSRTIQPSTPLYGTEYPRMC